MRSERGFTFIEFLIVFAIIGIILAIAIPSCNKMNHTQGTQPAERHQAEVAPTPPPAPRVTRFTEYPTERLTGVPCCTVDVTVLCDNVNSNLIYVMAGYDGRGALAVVPGGCK
jgi:prepilin-type N-terminal cleavage/methylation domain-containing protein